MSADTPQSALTGVFLYKYGCLYPAANFHWGISTQIWEPVPRSQLSPGYFRTNMGACTPQPTFTGVFLRKYGCLYPAASSHRGISAQIWVSIPRSQLSPGYFRANMGIYTPGTPAPRKNYRPLLAKAPHFLNTNLVHTKYKKARIPLQSGNAGILTLCIRIIHSYLRASSPGRLRCRHQ